MTVCLKIDDVGSCEAYNQITRYEELFDHSIRLAITKVASLRITLFLEFESEDELVVFILTHGHHLNQV